MNAQKSKRTFISVSAIMLLIMLALVTHGLLNEPTITDSEGTWFISSPYGAGDNSSYSITFHEVTFTFLMKEEGPLDRPIPIYLKLTFSDSTEEYLEVFVNGGLRVEPQVHYSNHTNPAVAVWTHMSDTDGDWYSWYYAVKIS